MLHLTVVLAEAQVTSSSGVRRYFALLQPVEQAVRDNDFTLARRHVEEGLALLPDVIEETRREFGRFDIVESPIVERGCLLFAVAGDEASLRGLRDTLVAAAPASPLADCAELWLSRIPMIATILERVRREPGIGQPQLRDELASTSPEEVSELCYWLSRTGRLQRIRRGRSYSLLPCAGPGGT